MRFESTLLEGTLVRRDRRFSADIKLNNGDEVTAHCANPGSLAGCAEPGSKVLISVQDNPRSRFKHHLEVIYAGRTPVGVHTGRPAGVVAEAITKGKVLELAGYATLRRDAKKDRVTRIDLVIEGNGLRPCFMKVENVTMAQEGVAVYPDTIIDNGPQAMSDLTNLVREGNRAMVMFVAPRSDVSSFKPSEEFDAEYTQALRDAAARGVEVLAYRAKVTKRGIELDQQLPVELGEN